MQVMEVLGRVVMLPINVLTTGTEMVAQSTKSVQKMAEKGVESVLGLESSDDDGHEAAEDGYGTDDHDRPDDDDD